MCAGSMVVMAIDVGALQRTRLRVIAVKLATNRFRFSITGWFVSLVREMVNIADQSDV